MSIRKKPELLAPAGNMEKCKMALYMGPTQFISAVTSSASEHMLLILT